jgi:hypothetical protein
VGKSIAVADRPNRPRESLWFFEWAASDAIGVGNKKHPHPPVGRSDSRSFKTANPDAVADALQLLANLVPGNAEDSRHVLKDAKTRHNVGDNPENLSPEISLVIFPSSPSHHADGLAGRPSVHNVDW